MEKGKKMMANAMASIEQAQRQFHTKLTEASVIQNIGSFKDKLEPVNNIALPKPMRL
jgi:hypothetical protein